MRFFKKAMDPVSSETHFIGAVLSLATLVMMMIIAIIEGSDHLTIIGIMFLDYRQLPCIVPVVFITIITRMRIIKLS